MRDVVTTLLDTLGLVLIAAGLGTAAYGLAAALSTVPARWPAGSVAAGLVVAGVTLLAGSWLADRAHRGGEPKT